MRILAVIPACEGSVVFPNKNMRVIQGKPLIYYSIHNALSSEYVSDVIVTSNSNEILSLAHSMGVKTRMRSEDLCNVLTSLDRVVWDVFDQLSISDYEYVVTMQPISPTLKTSTLDAAIRKTIEQDYDTMISVKNQSQFFWRQEGDEYIPLQKERMNRNLLPPFYMETGAFLITRSSCISSNTRIGSRVGLYELSGDEAIDINNFGDLKLAENALIRKDTAIFVNGNNQIGMGHITRMLQIADELFTKPDFYFDQNVTDKSAFGKTTYNLIPVDGKRGFIDRIKRKKYDLILNDVLNTSEGYMKELRQSASSKIINFEDEGEGTVYADLVFNALYEKEAGDNIVSGYRYYVIPKQFLIYQPVEISERVNNVIVTFGGADPENYTEKILNLALEEKYRNLHFYCILGAANQHIDILDDRYSKDNITIMQNIDNMAEIMSGCDAAVSSRGRTCFELAALGIPTLSIAQHEREEQHTFICEENGFLCLKARPEQKEIEEAFDKLLFMDRHERLDMQNKMLSYDLRNGRRNVVDRMLSF